jgi:hypothetical protein
MMKVMVRYFVSGNHKVVAALILIMLVLVLLDLTESLPSKCHLQIFLFHYGLLSSIVLDVPWLIGVPFFLVSWQISSNGSFVMHTHVTNSYSHFLMGVGYAQ